MSIREKMRRMLQNRGISPDEATAILAQYEGAPEAEPMQGRMDKDLEGCPMPLLAGVWLSIERTARNWLAANKPEHFARPLFAEEPD